MSTDTLGPPLSDSYAIPGGHARIHQRGVTIDGDGPQVVVAFAFPMVGRPAIVTGDPSPNPLFPDEDLRFSRGSWPLDQISSLVHHALVGRLGLAPVGQPAAAMPLTMAEPTVVTGEVLGISVRGGVLEERQLYDVVVRADGDRWHVIAPHALYHRAAWSDFGIAHVTDLHVARRIDRFRGLLAGAGMSDAAQRFFNWNDRFRGFIRYANYLHRIGVLDVIVATGDLYDYVYEDDDDPGGGGNAQFLRELILGQSPAPGVAEADELRVPIFLTAGNHDYRKHAYKLFADVHEAGTDILRLETFSGYNLVADEARRLTFLLDGRPDPGPARGAFDLVTEVSISDAARMVSIDKDLRPFRTFLADRTSYDVQLGPHRIVMLDSAYDVGVVTDTIDAIKVKLGHGSEDEATFVGGSPNSEGVTPFEVDMVTDALAHTPAPGLVIVGIHAPLFNVTDNQYPYFLRETQRRAQPGQVEGFLARHTPPPLNRPDLARGVHPTWFAGEHDHREPIFVKRVDSQDLLDFGVSRGHAEELIRLIAGLGTPRPADLVLSGHTHRYNEFSVTPMHTGELAFYMDFYTRNPPGYYPTKCLVAIDLGGGDVSVGGVTYIEVVPGTRPDTTPWPIPFEAKHGYQLQVPPYAEPLSSSADPLAWWKARRPLVLQTSAIGPRDDSAFSFTGFRLLTIRNNVIDRIDFVATEKLEPSGYELSWEEARRTSPLRHYRYESRSRGTGAPKAAGPPFGIVFEALGVVNVVYRDREGQLHELWRTGDGTGTGNLSAVTTGAPAAAGDPRSFIATADGLLVALYRAVDRHVHSLYWSTGAVGHDALSEVAGAPRAAGNPVGLVENDGSNVVIYRADDNHLHSLWWTGAAPPGTENLSAPAGALEARGDPAPYINLTTGEHVVAYRAADAHIHTLYWTLGPVGHDDLSGFVGSPTAAGDPVAYYTKRDDTHHVTYRSHDGHLHEIWWAGNNPASHWDLTLTAGAPPAASDPVAYYSEGTFTRHVIYRSADGHVHDLWWVRGRVDPAHVDLTVAAAAPLAADTPTAFTVEGPNTQHVVYRGRDDHLHEIWWAEQGFARLRNHWRPDMTIHIEEGAPRIGSVPLTYSSARWRFELVTGSDQFRIRNVWKPDHYLHIETGTIDCGTAGPGWLSARWTLEPIAGSQLVRLRNVWKPEQCLHTEGGTLESGAVEPGWLSAMWMVEYEGHG